MLKLLNIIFLQLIFLHLIGCFYYYITKINLVWIPPSDSLVINGNYTLDYQIMYSGDDIHYEYWTIFYYSVLIFTVNDITTAALIERIYVSYIAILSSIVNANMFGIITILIQDMKTKEI